MDAVGQLPGRQPSTGSGTSLGTTGGASGTADSRYGLFLFFPVYLSPKIVVGHLYEEFTYQFYKEKIVP